MLTKSCSHICNFYVVWVLGGGVMKQLSILYFQFICHKNIYSVIQTDEKHLFVLEQINIKSLLLTKMEDN